MFSKTFLKRGLSVLALSVFVFSGCDTKLGETPPPQANQQFSGAQCLSDMKPVIKAFIAGDANPVELEGSWQCLGGALEKFKRYVRGRSSDRYTSQELATFLENNFLSPSGNQKISVGLQKEFMKIKQVFVGGSSEHLTLAEVDKLISLTQSLKGLTVDLNPYMKVLSLNWAVTPTGKLQRDVEYFENANEQIQTAARTLATLIEKNGKGYRLSDFVSFMEEMGGFFGEKWDFPKTITKYMPVIQKVKRALAGGDQDLITPNEWIRFSLLGARGYVQFLRYYYFIKSVPETGTGYRLSYLSRSVEDLLSVFQDLVAEKPEGVVTRAEVTDLLETLQSVWPDFKVSENLVFEAMKVKQLVFGGTTDSFTTKDFETARLKVGRIKTVIERFLPYYAIFGKDWEPDIYDPDEAQKLFLESQFVLESTAREVGALLEGTYDLKNIVSLLREVEVLYPPEKESKAEKVKSFLPLVVDTKNMILGGTDSTLRQPDWSVLLSFASRAYSDFLYYGYFIKGKDKETPLSVRHLSVFSNQSLNILRDLISTKKEKYFSRSELNKIARHLVKLEILPKGLLSGSIDQLLGVVLNNFLMEPSQRIGGKQLNALNLSSVEVARRELQVWLDTEFFIAELTEGWSGRDGLDPSSLLKVLQKNQRRDDVSSFLQTGLKELILSVQSPVPVTLDSESRVVISNRFEQRYNSGTLFKLNLYRAMSRWLMRAFVYDSDRIATYSGATLKEVEAAYFTLKPSLVEMGLLSKDNMTFPSSRFREANIFVPHSDGNALASHAEMTDLIAMIMSGSKIDSFLRKDLVRECLNGNDKVSGDTVVGLSCVRAAYKDSMKSAMTATPEYLRFMKSASKDEWAIYMNNIFKAAGYVPNERSMARIEDIAIAPHVMQYVEMIYARFDMNQDGIIETEESYKAFPAFKGTLKELAKDQLASGSLKESQLLDLFTYILRYGKPPETTKEKLRFVFKWRGKSEKWDVWADRVQLAQILGYIADKASEAAKKNLRKISSESSVNLSELQSPSHFE